jgi:hypothetical protein
MTSDESLAEFPPMLLWSWHVAEQWPGESAFVIPWKYVG